MSSGNKNAPIEEYPALRASSDSVVAIMQRVNRKFT
jgi:hypothetical protein